MRVCLVAPPTLEDFDEGPVTQTESSVALVEHSPIGILSLASILESRGITPWVFDLNRLHFECSWPDRFYYRKVDFCALAVSELRDSDFDILGLSTMCSTYPLSLRIACELKKARPELIIVLGGPQASIVDLETLAAFPCVDFIVRGEAEESFPAFLDCISGTGKLADIPGITYRDHGTPVRTPDAPLILDLDTLPLPAFHLYPGMQFCRFIPLELGRGCPFSCTFCSTNDFFRRRFRVKSPARMIEQMSAVEAAYGITSFDLVHDMFTVDRRKVVAFCEALVQSGKNFTWSCSARTDCVDEKLLQQMANAGCASVFFGVESGSARMQKIFDKGLDIGQAARMVQCTAEIGVAITVSMIDGFPEEEEEDFRETVSFLVDAARYEHVKPQINLLAPLAKTPLTERFRQQLVFDNLFSDMSHQGWYQDAADRELIARYPNIFPNFYGLPCPLGREYLDEFNRFFMNSLLRFHWLMIGLHQISGNLLEVFNLWLRCRTRKDTSTRYYATPEFAADFKRFVRQAQVQKQIPQTPLLTTLLDFYDLLEQHLLDTPTESHDVISGSERTPFSLEACPRLAPSVTVLPLSCDVKPIIDALRELRPDASPGSPAVFVARRDDKGMVEIFRIPEVSSEVLELCNGRAPVAQILEDFSRTHEDSPEITSGDLCRYGLELLEEAGVIEFACGSTDASSVLAPA
jgi:radical SAM superfamily enzyme YgiQ (UPF0313 family)